MYKLNSKGEYKLLWTDNPNYKFKKDDKVLPALNPRTPVNPYKDTMFSVVLGQDDNGIEVCGDIFFKVMNAKGNKLICRFAINTSFLFPRARPVKNKPYYCYYIDKKGVDPDSIAKDKRFDINFRLGLFYEDICQMCTPATPVNNLCNQCTREMKTEVQEWSQINQFIKR